MDMLRSWPRVARSAVVAGLGLAALAAARPAPAQFDMTPYRPYGGQYRSSGFPADQASTGDAILGPATTASVPGVGRGYRNDVIGDRVGADLDRDLFDEGPARPEGPRKFTPRYRNPADRQVAQDRTLRDRYYLEAQRETNPKKRAELMDLYRRENRRLSRALSTRSPAAPAADREPDARRDAAPRAAAPARREPEPALRTPTARPRTEERRAPAPAPAPASAPRPAARPAPTTGTAAPSTR